MTRQWVLFSTSRMVGPKTGDRRPLRYLRRITPDADAVAVTIMPELIFKGSGRLLHNQRALYVKRLLLFEPRANRDVLVVLLS